MEDLNPRFMASISRADASPVWLVRISVSRARQNTKGKVEIASLRESGVQAVFVSGAVPLFDLPNSVDSVSMIGSRIDPFSREFSSTSMDILFADDGALRDFATLNWLKGKQVQVYLGSPELDIEDFESRFRGIIDDVIPDEGSIVLRCSDLSSTIRDTKATGDWINYHPLSVIRSLGGNIALDSGIMFDVDSFIPSVGDEPRRHWRISRTKALDAYGGPGGGAALPSWMGALDEPINAMRIMDDMLLLLGGALVVNRRGDMVYRRFDRFAPSVRTLTVDDIDQIEQVDSAAHLYNRFTMSFLMDSEQPNQIRSGQASNTPFDVYTQGTHQTTYSVTAFDLPAAQELAFPGTGARVIETEVETAWLNGLTRLLTTIPFAAAPGAFFSLYIPDLVGFPSAELDAAHRAIFLIGNELIEADMVARGTFEVMLPPGRVRSGGLNRAFNYEYRISQRGVLGTEILAHNAQEYVVDFTIPVAATLDKILRFSRGIPILEFTASMRHLDLELGDQIRIDDSVVLLPNIPTVDVPRQRWEIVGKDEDPSGDRPQIKFRIAGIGRGNPAPIVQTIGGTFDPTTRHSAVDS